MFLFFVTRTYVTRTYVTRTYVTRTYVTRTYVTRTYVTRTYVTRTGHYIPTDYLLHLLAVVQTGSRECFFRCWRRALLRYLHGW